MDPSGDRLNVRRTIQASHCCSCRQHLSAKGTSAICSGRSSGFRIVPILPLPMKFTTPTVTLEFGLSQWFVAGSVPDYSGGTATDSRFNKSVTVFPFHSHPCCLASNLTPYNTREHLNRVVCTHAQATRGTLINDNLKATADCRVDSLSCDPRIRV